MLPQSYPLQTAGRCALVVPGQGAAYISQAQPRNCLATASSSARRGPQQWEGPMSFLSTLRRLLRTSRKPLRARRVRPRRTFTATVELLETRDCPSTLPSINSVLLDNYTDNYN